MTITSLLAAFINIVLHIDVHLAWIIAKFGLFSYLILFLVIFFETALVFTPFLPGDSLIFAAGAFAAIGSFNVFILFFLLSLAAILGDSVNYSIGHYLGKKIIRAKSEAVHKLVKKEYIEKTKHFFDKYGNKTIVIARFIPIVRTFAPFLAGVGNMDYWKFLSYNVFGGIFWVALSLFAGFFLGNIPFVKDNFSLVILAVVVVSFIPVLFEFFRHRFNEKRKKKNN